MAQPLSEALAFVSPFIRIAHDFVTPAFTLLPRQINDHALLYFKEGGGTYTDSGETYPIRRGTLFLCRPRRLHSFVGKGSPFAMLNIHLDMVEHPDSEQVHYLYRPDDPAAKRRVAIISDKRGDPDYLPVMIPITNPAAYEQLFFRVHRLFGLRDVRSNLQIKSAAIDLLAFIYTQVAAGAVSETVRGQLPGLESAVQFMRANFARPLSHDEIAAQAHLSRSYFARCFKEYYHISPLRFLNYLRIENAKSELTMTARPIKEIAVNSGFESVHHFTRVFSKTVSLSPAAYRTVYKGQSVKT
jgi:AraC family transcriptional regulator of arabinose operon